jgi:hypothetical protein
MQSKKRAHRFSTIMAANHLLQNRKQKLPTIIHIAVHGRCVPVVPTEKGAAPALLLSLSPFTTHTQKGTTIYCGVRKHGSHAKCLIGHWKERE